MKDKSTPHPPPKKNQLLSFRVSKCRSPSLKSFFFRVLIHRRGKISLSLSRHRQSSRATRRKKTADDLNDGETCVIRVRFFFPLFARSVSSLSLSLSLCSRGFLYAVCREIFFAPFFPLGGAWCRATREGRKRKNKGVAKARLDANRWNRAQKNAARVVFERRGARRRVGRRARPRPRSRDLDFLFWVGHLIPRGSSPCVRAC